MPDTRLEMTPETFRLIRAVVNDYSGIDMAEDRREMYASRLAPRASEAGCRSFLDYYHILKYEGERELQLALEALTNRETYFLREIAQIETLARIARSAAGTFRILSAGCASGEEPYSVAMMLLEAGAGSGVEIVGIDIAECALGRARAGVYAPSSFRGVDRQYLTRYFRVHENGMLVHPSLSRMVRFERVNLLAAEQLLALGPFDAILCRNVMIYFDRPSIAKAIANLSGVLMPGGILFLGHSESLHDIPNRLEIVRLDSVIAYRKPSAAPRDELRTDEGRDDRRAGVI